MFLIYDVLVFNICSCTENYQDLDVNFIKRYINIKYATLCYKFHHTIFLPANAINKPLPFIDVFI